MELSDSIFALLLPQDTIHLIEFKWDRKEKRKCLWGCYYQYSQRDIDTVSITYILYVCLGGACVSAGVTFIEELQLNGVLTGKIFTYSMPKPTPHPAFLFL